MSHTGAVADLEEDIVAEGAQIVWVLETDIDHEPGTVDSCMYAMDVIGSEGQGWCVGDGETTPGDRPFDSSPFSVDRGFDMIVARESMRVLWQTSHGKSDENDNIDGEETLQAVRDVVAALR